MNRLPGLCRGLVAGAAALSALALTPQVRAGFTPEALEGFELTHLRGVVSTVLPEKKVIEVIDPEGHKEIITVGIDISRLGLKPGDGVDVSVLDGLVVELERSRSKELSFNREDIIIPEDMGPLRKGMRGPCLRHRSRDQAVEDRPESQPDGTAWRHPQPGCAGDARS